MADNCFKAYDKPTLYATEQRRNAGGVFFFGIAGYESSGGTIQLQNRCILQRKETVLFVLTGDIQTGKTRWLQELVDSMLRAGIATYGVIAPGVWIARSEEVGDRAHVDRNGFEKLGIDNVLLPSGERIPFARRIDLALAESSFDACAQSARAGLGWHIDDAALQRVNDHFKALIEQNPTRNGSERPPSQIPGVLIIDELGRLELERNQGLTEALAILDAGPQPDFQHAIIVVRKELLPRLTGRFTRWGNQSPIHPDAASAATIMNTLLGR